MGRPLKEIDEILLEKLTRLHLSDKVICDILGCHEDTLLNRFSEKMDEWRSVAKRKIAEVLFDEAINKREPWALKAVVQKHLDYSDKTQIQSDVKHSYSDKSTEELQQLAQDKIKKLGEGV